MKTFIRICQLVNYYPCKGCVSKKFLKDSVYYKLKQIGVY